MPDTAAAIPNDVASKLRAKRDRVDQLESELGDARTAYYAAIAGACRDHRQVDVADVLGMSRQRVSELANRAPA